MFEMLFLCRIPCDLARSPLCRLK